MIQYFFNNWILILCVNQMILNHSSHSKTIQDGLLPNHIFNPRNMFFLKPDVIIYETINKKKVFFIDKAHSVISV